MPRIHSNNYVTVLSNDITDVATTMVVGSVAKLPVIGSGVECYLTLDDGVNIEIVKATSNSTTTITMVRAQESTTNVAFLAGTSVSLRPTANSVDRKLDKYDYTTTATAAGTTTLTIASTRFQYFTGSTTQTVVLPVTSTLSTGQEFEIVNLSSNVVTVQSSGANTIQALAANTRLRVTCILTSGTSTASWSWVYLKDAGNLDYSPGNTDVVVADGGTGRSVTVAYAPIVGGTTTTAAMQSVLVGSAGQVLQSGGASAIPVYSTPTYPSTSGTANKRLKADGTNIVYTTTTMPDTGTTGKVLIGDGTNYVESTSTIPTSAGATALKHLKSDGTNYVLTTATISDTPSTAGKMLTSDGTNWITSTPTFPNSSATALKHIRSDGTNWIASTATISDTPSTAGKTLISDGTNWITSTPTFPNASATTRKIIVSDGTNWTASTETYAVPSTSGKVMQSDGTNWTSATPTGTGTPVLATTPTLVTPVLGVATATSVNFGQDALNYYDEGTWTPSFDAATPGDLALSSVTASGYYTRVGRLVAIHFRLVVTPTYTTASGAIRITGLPFTVSSDLNNNQAFGPMVHGAAFTYSAGKTFANVNPISSQTYMQIVATGSASTVSTMTLAISTPSTTAQTLIGTTIYYV